MGQMKSKRGFESFGVKPKTPLLIAALAALLSVSTLGVWSKDAPGVVTPVNSLGVSAVQCLELSKLDPVNRIEAGDSLGSEWIEAGKLRPPGVTAGPMLAAHCRLSGKTGQRKGVDDKNHHIGFELRLPASWNGRFLFQGGGGNDGVVRPAVGPQASVDYALNKGFAVVTTDAGHQGTDASFGYDPLARIDHAYRSYDIVASKAKELIQRHYHQGAQKSYFVGCSGGGRQGMVMQDAMKHEFVTPPDPSLSIFTFNFDRDPARMDAYAWIYNTEADVQLEGFKARGSKLLLAHGMADPIFSANESVDYYQRMQATHGASTSDFARLFLIPGMGHCAGGAATDAWEGLDSLVAWVEKNQAPQGIVARGTKVFPGRTRPLCAWPSYSHYKGSGDVESAENFECRQ
jgi:pimeloyl-ACP methyl ester carboxylesterase